MKNLLFKMCLFLCVYKIHSSNQCFQTDPVIQEFLCPITYAETGGFELIVTPLKEVKIQCENMTSFSINQLPNILIDRINRLQMQFCPFPTEGFGELLGWFGTKRIAVLEYNYGNPEQTLEKKHFRGLHQLGMLKISRNTFKEVEDDLFIDAPNLIALELRENDLIHLKREFFDGLPHLEWLDLIDNKIEVLPDAVFERLSKLLYLRLWGNNIQELRESSFKGLLSLESLDLSGNCIDSISKYAFQPLKNLVNVSLAFNQLSSIPNNLFISNIKLKSVLLSDNPNLVLFDYMLANTSLEEVDLGNCNIEHIPETLFQNSRKLQVVSFRNNSIYSIPKQLFQNTKLEKLDLSQNYIKHLDFPHLVHMKVLSLQSNLIQSINKTTFLSLNRLEELDLSRNQITRMHPDCFSHNDHLKIINLSNNMYSGEDVVLKNVVYLEEVDFSHNCIRRVEHVISLQNKMKLQTLNLSYNCMRNVSFSSLQGVSDIDINLEHNNITNIEVDSFNGMSNLFSSTIHLGYNPVQCDCSNYDLLDYFSSDARSLLFGSDMTCANPENLKGQQVTTLPLDSIICNLNDTCPETCRCSWRPYDTAVLIDCANQNLTEVPHIDTSGFEYLNFSQMEIDLRKNNLTLLNFTELDDVTSLLLSYNQLVNIFGLPRNLQVLMIDHNNLTRLGPKLLKSLDHENFTTLRLEYNPWACTCGAETLSGFMRKYPNQIISKNVYCDQSKKLLVDLTQTDLCHNNLVFYIILPVLLITVLLMVPLVLFYRYQQPVKVWLFSQNLCLSWVTEEDLDQDKIYDVFICYSNKDEDFVINDLVQVLETAPNNYQLCLHYRDWVPGEFIVSQVTSSVLNSKRTLVVLSENFLESIWGKAEFRTAHSQTMTEGKARVIVVLYGEINIEQLDEELKAYLKTNTYLKWGDPYFWKKLKYALPHSKKKSPH